MERLLKKKTSMKTENHLEQAIFKKGETSPSGMPEAEPERSD